MRRLRALGPALALSGLVAAGFALAAQSAGGPAPRCTRADNANGFVKFGGYIRGCGRGSAVVHVDGVRYRMFGTQCIVGPGGGRMYFGTRLLVWDGTLAPRSSLYLVVEKGDAGVDVIDGGVTVVNGRTGVTLTGAISGTAKPSTSPWMKRGTFAIHGRSESADGKDFTGSWICG